MVYIAYSVDIALVNKVKIIMSVTESYLINNTCIIMKALEFNSKVPSSFGLFGYL
jgi:hypothetical protein